MSTTVVDRPTTDLRPHALSLSIYGQPQVDDLRDGIAAGGILVPLQVKPDGTIISGHRRWVCALELGLPFVPVIEVDFGNALEEQRAIIEYNRQRVKTFSQRMREAQELERLERERARQRQATGGRGWRGGRPLPRNCGEGVETSDAVAKAVGLGSGDTYRRARFIWDMAARGMCKALEVLPLLDQEHITIYKAYSLVRNAQDDEYPSHARVRPYTTLPPFAQRGQLYFLVPPCPYDPVVWLMCGDACSHEDMAKAMCGRKAQLVHLDPPYGVGYEGAGAWDNLSGEQLLSLLRDAFKESHLASDDKAGLWLWFAATKIRTVLRALDASGWRERNHFIWVKDQVSGALWGRAKAQCEHLYFAAKVGESPRWAGPRDERDVWFYKKPLSNPCHPTPKPLPLVMRAIEDASSPGDVVLDAFLGSGTTLVAATKLKRGAVGVEISPAYCDLAIVNWLRENPGGELCTEEMAQPCVDFLCGLAKGALADPSDVKAWEEVLDQVNEARHRLERLQDVVWGWLYRCGLKRGRTIGI